MCIFFINLLSDSRGSLQRWASNWIPSKWLQRQELCAQGAQIVTICRRKHQNRLVTHSHSHMSSPLFATCYEMSSYSQHTIDILLLTADVAYTTWENLIIENVSCAGNTVWQVRKKWTNASLIFIAFVFNKHQRFIEEGTILVSLKVNFIHEKNKQKQLIQRGIL